jgi:hypothetical protein
VRKVLKKNLAQDAKTVENKLKMKNSSTAHGL